MKVLRLTLVGCFLLGLTAFARADADKANDKDSLQKKLVGVWEPVKGDFPPGSSVEFTDDGKLKISIKVEDKTMSLDGTFKVLDDKTIETTLKEGDKEMTEKLTITTLTDTELVTKDSKDKLDMFKRKK